MLPGFSTTLEIREIDGCIGEYKGAAIGDKAVDEGRCEGVGGSGGVGLFRRVET